MYHSHACSGLPYDAAFHQHNAAVAGCKLATQTYDTHTYERWVGNARIKNLISLLEKIPP